VPLLRENTGSLKKVKTLAISDLILIRPVKNINHWLGRKDFDITARTHPIPKSRFGRVLIFQLKLQQIPQQ
jgi:hypothetical protein